VYKCTSKHKAKFTTFSHTSKEVRVCMTACPQRAPSQRCVNTENSDSSVQIHIRPDLQFQMCTARYREIRFFGFAAHRGGFQWKLSYILKPSKLSYIHQTIETVIYISNQRNSHIYFKQSQEIYDVLALSICVCLCLSVSLQLPDSSICEMFNGTRNFGSTFFQESASVARPYFRG